MAMLVVTRSTPNLGDKKRPIKIKYKNEYSAEPENSAMILMK